MSKYTKAIYLYYKDGKTYVFETKWISMIDVPYGRYALI